MKKYLDFYLHLKHPVLLTEGVDNGVPYVEASIPDLPGCGASGKTRDEALQLIEEAKELWIEARMRRGLPIPEPVSEDEFSGKFLLRITPDLHRRLSVKARKENSSLNQYIRRMFERNLDIENILEKMKSFEQELISLRTAIMEQRKFHQGTSAVSATFAQNYGMLMHSSGVYSALPLQSSQVLSVVQGQTEDQADIGKQWRWEQEGT